MNKNTFKQYFLLLLIFSFFIFSTCEIKTPDPEPGERTVTNIVITRLPTKTTYNDGDSFDREGMVITAMYSDGTSGRVTDYTVVPEILSIGDTFVTVSYSGISKTVNIRVKLEGELIVTGITVTTPPSKTMYFAGEPFSTEGMVVTADYDDGSKEAVTEYTVTPSEGLTLGTTSVTITYQGYNATVPIIVLNDTPVDPSTVDFAYGRGATAWSSAQSPYNGGSNVANPYNSDISSETQLDGSAGTAAKWFAVDLGQERTISTVRITWGSGSDGLNPIMNYTVDAAVSLTGNPPSSATLSGSAGWTNVVTVNNTERIGVETHNFTETQARFVRIRRQDGYNSAAGNEHGDWPRLVKFEIYGKGIPDPELIDITEGTISVTPPAAGETATPLGMVPVTGNFTALLTSISPTPPGNIYAEGTVYEFTFLLTPFEGHRFKLLGTGQNAADITVGGGSFASSEYNFNNLTMTAVRRFPRTEGGSHQFSTDYTDKNFDPELTSFYDKFEGNSLDLTKWSYQNGNGSAYGIAGWGNGELQSYDTQQVTVSDGVLRLTAQRRRFDSRDYVSGKLVTANGRNNSDLNEPPGNTGNKFSQTYGRFEAKIRLTKAVRGLWPAFWMMPANAAYGGWPRSGEIDIMEMVGNMPSHASSTIHVQRPWGHHYRGAEYVFPTGLDYTSFHVFGVRWTAEEMRFTVNNQLIRRMTPSDWNSTFYSNSTAPFDQPFHLILNLAINGGAFSGDSWIGANDGELPIALEVEWVRVYTIENDPWPLPTELFANIRNYQN